LLALMTKRCGLCNQVTAVTELSRRGIYDGSCKSISG
jgi:hypothetical protein